MEDMIMVMSQEICNHALSMSWVAFLRIFTKWW
jgi:hypothetical protein